MSDDELKPIPPVPQLHLDYLKWLRAETQKKAGADPALLLSSKNDNKHARTINGYYQHANHAFKKLLIFLRKR